MSNLNHLKLDVKFTPKFRSLSLTAPAQKKSQKTESSTIHRSESRWRSPLPERWRIVSFYIFYDKPIHGSGDRHRSFPGGISFVNFEVHKNDKGGSCYLFKSCL